MRVDAHQHFWEYSRDEFGWIDAGSPIERDFYPADLDPLLRSARMDFTIAVQARQSVRETQRLLSLAEAHDWIAKVVGWEEISADDLERRLEGWASFPKLAGFRHLIQDESDPEFFLGERFVRGVRSLLARGFTYDILIRSPQYSRLSKFLELVGPGKLIIDHAAKPNIKAGHWSDWAACVKDAARYPYVYCKLSGFITEADTEHWTPSQIEPYLEHLFQCFGPDRLIFGSDWPVCLLAGQYHAAVSLVENFAVRRSPDDAKAIMGGNAASFYGIEIKAR